MGGFKRVVSIDSIVSELGLTKEEALSILYDTDPTVTEKMEAIALKAHDQSYLTKRSYSNWIEAMCPGDPDHLVEVLREAVGKKEE